jgi:ATP-dependent protease Clp ATPase subunit
MNEAENPRCSFCGHSASEVDRILAGPSVAICDKCIILSAEIAGENRPDWWARLIERVTAVRDKGK